MARALVGFPVTCREKPISVRSLRTLLGLIECPWWQALTAACRGSSTPTAADASDRPVTPGIVKLLLTPRQCRRISLGY